VRAPHLLLRPELNTDRSLPLSPTDERIIPQLAEQDKDLLNGLKKAGFKTTLGPDNSGFITMALEKAGGYYFNTVRSSSSPDLVLLRSPLTLPYLPCLAGLL
jgi:hypothetical protein